MQTRVTLRTLLALSISAQGGFGFHNLAATRDGSALYFVSEHRLRGTSQPGHSKIFRLTDAGVELVAAREKPSTGDGTLKDFYNVYRPLLDDPGRLVAYSIQDPCDPVTVWNPFCPLTAVHVNGQDRGIGAAVWLSGDGRYLGTSSRGRLRQVTDRITDLRDGTTSGVTTFEMGLFFTSDGEVVFQQSGDVVAVRGTESRVITRIPPGTHLATSSFVSHPNRAGALLRQWNLPLRWFDAKDGKIIEVTPRSCFDAKFAGGDWFVASCEGSLWLGELFSSQPLEQLPLSTADIEEFAPARRGEVVWFRTKDGAIHKYEAATGRSRLMLIPPVSLVLPAAIPAGGQLLEIRGQLLPTTTPGGLPLPDELAGVRIRMNGQPAPIHSISATRLVVQVPWQIRQGPVDIQMQLPGNSSVFEASPPSQPPYAWAVPFFFRDIGAIRHDWSGFVTRERPARPGELVHLYGSSFGGVSEELPNGMPAPLDRLLPLRDPAECTSSGRPVRVVWAGLAPGYFGIYQLTVEAMAPVPTAEPVVGPTPIECRFAGHFATHSIWVARQ